MTLVRLATASLWFYRRTQLAVVLGVASAVAVLAGSFLVGSSVRSSLASIAASRTGRTAIVVGAELPFTTALGDRLLVHSALGGAAVVPLFSLQGVVRDQASGRRAGNVLVYGVDDRFFAFHGVEAAAPGEDDVLLSPDLAAELAPEAEGALIVRVARPTDVPIDSLQGRKDDVGRSMRLTYRGTLASTAMGEFSLSPTQGPVRAAFVSLARVERDLALVGRANTLLVSAGGRPEPGTLEIRNALAEALTTRDLGLNLEWLASRGTILVESDSGLVAEPLVPVVTRAAESRGLRVTPVLSWLATRMTVGPRAMPYSLVTALGSDAAGDPALARLLAGAPDGTPRLVLNDWAARDLRARTGDEITLEYFRWADEGRLVTDQSVFRVAGVVPIQGLAADRRLAPDYPGISDTNSLADWDPPFPIDLRLVRPQDDEYWDRYRATPKAFITLEAGQSLWRTRHGQVTSLRLSVPPDANVDALMAGLREDIARGTGALRAGLNIADVRAGQQAASVGATDFGQYFSYFSFFLMVSALLLAALFFRLAVEQRLAQIGVLRAAGFTLARVRKLFLIEGAVISAAGGAIGLVLAVAWAALMMYGLRTWWSGAVGTTRLELDVDAVSLLAGVAGGAIAAALSIAGTVRHLSRLTPRQLLTGSRDIMDAPRSVRRVRTVMWIAGGSAVVLAVLSLARLMPAAAGFFGAGALVLTAGLTGFKAWLGRPAPGSIGGTRSVVRLGVRNASWRPGRSMTAAGLVASAVFLLVSVDSFRKTAGDETGPRSGTGGFALVAEAALPLVHDPSTADGRDALGLQFAADDPDLSGVTFVAARLRAGDDTSCLNLYRPQRPRVLGVPREFADTNRFRFGTTLAASEDERENPWRLLGPADGEGVVPAVVDQTSLQYVLHAAVGDVITIDEDTARPVSLRVVAALDDTVLQGEILIGEEAFRSLFPAVAGYHVLFVELSDPARSDAVAQTIEERLEPFGVDAQDAARRLAAFHQVENTYLSTFQTLGGLGLVLGCLGLAAVIARNVLERRRELALLGAAGYTGRDLQVVVLSENVTIIVVGLTVGLVAALVATGPVLVARGGAVPLLPLVWLAVVGVTGLLASMAATRSLRRMAIVPALRSE